MSDVIDPQNSDNYNLKQSQIIHYVFLRPHFSGRRIIYWRQKSSLKKGLFLQIHEW